MFTMAKEECSRCVPMMQIQASSILSDVQCDEIQKLPIDIMPESQVKGTNGYQKYYHVTLIVTIEQEDAIVDLFNQRNWTYFKAGEGQTFDDLQAMCDRMSGVSHEVDNADQVIEFDIDTDLQPEYNKYGTSRETGCLSDVKRLIESSDKALLTTDSTYITVKEEKETEDNTSNISECLTYNANVSSNISQTLTGVPALESSNEGIIDRKDSKDPTLTSFVPRLNLAGQTIFQPAQTTKPNQELTTSATSGSFSFDILKLGIRCECCEAIFGNQTDFDNHISYGKCQWMCPFCKKAFVCSSSKKRSQYCYSLFKKKLDKHKKECDQTCKLCGYVAAERAHYVRHMKDRHSNDRKHACDICLMTFKSETKLYTHKITKHIGESELYYCPLCPTSREYGNLKSLSAHMDSNHFGQKREVACTVCGQVMDIYSIKHHEETHKIKDIKCDQCPAVFNSETYLRQHQRRHNKDYSHYCDTCGKGFYGSQKLKTHQRIHTGEKPFSCSECEYTCNSKPNLYKHMKIHKKKALSTP